MANFLRNGTSFRISNEASMEVSSRLPAGNYTIQQDQFGNMFLERIDSFNISGKLYGDIKERAQRILNTFHLRSASTGVLLTGEKGSGKSLLAKLLCQTAAAGDIPTIIVSNPWHGEKFNSFIQSIDHECVVLFDEFEKTYDKEQQESLLTLLDGVFPSKKLFILTCNDKYRIDDHMRNRPGRIFYTVDYKGLGEQFIREYCEDNLSEKKYIDQICNIAAMFSAFNFDMLKALIEEMNRYNESPDKSLEMLNVKAEHSGDATYLVQVETAAGVLFPEGLLSGETEVDVNPLALDDYPLELRLRLPGSAGKSSDDDSDDCVPIEAYSAKPSADIPKEVAEFFLALELPTALGRSYKALVSEGHYFRLRIDTEGLTSVDSKKGVFVFKAHTGHVVKLRKKPAAYRNLNGLVF